MENYQMLLTLSQRMLHLASSGQWSELVTLTAEYVTAAAIVPASSSNDNLLPAQEQLRTVLHQLLENERRIATLLAQRKQQLSMLIKHSRCQQNLMSTYASHTGQVLLPQISTPVQEDEG